MGTDFTYADMTKANVASYRYKMLKASEMVNGEECWVIESVPVDDKTRGETGYMKTVTWVSKSKLLPLRLKAWVIQGKRIKFIQFNEYKQIDGVWVAHQLVAETKRKKKRESQTVMQYSGLKLNDSSVVSDLFATRPRKGNLMRLRLLGIVLSVFLHSSLRGDRRRLGGQVSLTIGLPIPPLTF